MAACPSASFPSPRRCRGPGLAFAQAPACPQFFAGGQPPALLNPKLGQRATLLCSDAYAVLWAGIEMAVRHLAQRRGELFVVTGPAFQGQALNIIGPDGVKATAMVLPHPEASSYARGRPRRQEAP